MLENGVLCFGQNHFNPYSVVLVASPKQVWFIKTLIKALMSNTWYSSNKNIFFISQCSIQCVCLNVASMNYNRVTIFWLVCTLNWSLSTSITISFQSISGFFSLWVDRSNNLCISTPTQMKSMGLSYFNMLFKVKWLPSCTSYAWKKEDLRKHASSIDLPPYGVDMIDNSNDMVEVVGKPTWKGKCKHGNRGGSTPHPPPQSHVAIIAPISNSSLTWCAHPFSHFNHVKIVIVEFYRRARHFNVFSVWFEIPIHTIARNILLCQNTTCIGCYIEYCIYCHMVYVSL